MTDLLTRLAAATEGSRELDVEIWEIADPADCRSCWWDLYTCTNPDWSLERKIERTRAFMLEYPPRYTTSLDAARTLVPEGWRVAQAWTSAVRADGEAWFVALARGYHSDDNYACRKSENIATFPLAVCIAALKAKEQSDGIR